MQMLMERLSGTKIEHGIKSDVKIPHIFAQSQFDIHVGLTEV